MGSPNAPAFGDIFMYLIIEETKEFSIQLLMFYRYADDCFAVFPNRDIALKFNHDLNAIHKDVEFTYEIKHTKQLAFLDVCLDNSTGCTHVQNYQYTGNQHILDYRNGKVCLR